MIFRAVVIFRGIKFSYNVIAAFKLVLLAVAGVASKPSSSMLAIGLLLAN